MSLYGQDLAYIHASAFEELARGSAPEIIRRLRSTTLPIRRVLDIGCGAGPLTASLIEAGFEVTGIDISVELLDIARKRAATAQFIQAPAYEFDTRGYDAVIALGEPLTYHEDLANADHLVTSFFRRVAQSLPTAGMLIFDLIGLGGPSLTSKTWMAGEDWAVLVETTEEQSRRTLTRSIETFHRVGELYRRGQEVHHVRLFEIDKLSNLLSTLGFSVESARCYGAQQLPPRRYAFFAVKT